MRKTWVDKCFPILEPYLGFLGFHTFDIQHLNGEIGAPTLLLGRICEAWSTLNNR